MKQLGANYSDEITMAGAK